MSFELSILDAIQNVFQCSFMDKAMPLVTKLGDNGVFWIVCALVLLFIPKTKRMGIAIAVSLILELLICNILLKPLVARVRPCDVNTAFTLLVSRPVDYSFPSGHTCASFAAMSAILFSKNRLWIPAAVIAVVVAFSRLYLYVHYPSDVLAGALLGMLCGWLACVNTKKESDQY
ncbi:MAG: phosphatase PAP2 family protein [Blautia sp.]|nr:phosphatase PAP2 family protein [Blautia sp.]